MRAGRPARKKMASMGPPIYIGGNLSKRRCHHGSYNASMGPPIYIGGNWRFTVTLQRILPGLQWGHRFTSVETENVVRRVHPPVCASMGPPIYIGGNAPVSGIGQLLLKASMGPPIYIGGNPPASFTHRGVKTPLQWGHRFTSVETKTSR